MDYLLGSGATQVTTFLLGAVAQPAVNASVRGSGTLLGPITVVANSVRALIIPFLSRRHRSGHALTPSVHLTMLLILFSLPLVVGVNLIPDSWGIFLLGETWTLTEVVLPLLSLELVFALVSNVPFAGHRSLGAHRRTLALRSILAPLRVATIVMAALVTGYVGAAVAMLATSAVSALVWWWSYRQLVRGNFSERGLSLTR
jgi:O-antigen/teichoic acid export membrane protein